MLASENTNVLIILATTVLTHMCVFAVNMNYPEILILPFIYIWKSISLHFIYTTY